MKPHPFFPNDQGDLSKEITSLTRSNSNRGHSGIWHKAYLGGKGLTMLGVQQLGAWVWLKTLKPAQQGTSK